MSVAARLKEYLDTNQADYHIITHARSYTAQDTAAAAHVPGRELAKTVVVKADGRFVLAVLPAPRKIDLDRLKSALGAEQTRVAYETEFSSLFPECEVGAMPPFGNLYGLEVFVDRSLREDEEIVFNASTHVEAIRMKYSEFERLARPRVADFSSVGR